ADDLEEMDLKWQMAMLTVRARRFLQRTGRNLGANGPTSMGFDMSKVECYNCHRKGHFARECRSPKDTRRNGFESVEARLLVYQQNETVFEEDIKLLKLKVQLRDNALVVLRKNLEKAKQERDDLKLKLEKYQSRYGYHAVPPPYTGIFMPPKRDLVFHNAPNVDKTVHTAFNVELSPTKPDNDLSRTHRPLAPIIEDWVSDSGDDSETKVPQNVPSFVQPTEQVKSHRPSV
nr:ribonuclease H-like domain-containing protein [Tanacetum cinerariifolium]